MQINTRKLIETMMTPTARQSLFNAASQAHGAQHAEATVEHMLIEMLSHPKGEPARILKDQRKNRESLLERAHDALRRIPSSATARPVFSETLLTWIRDTWLTASVEFGDTAIRTGMMLVQLIKQPDRYLAFDAPELEDISVEELSAKVVDLLALSDEAIEAEPAGEAGGAPAAPRRGQSALERFCKNFTEEAREGRIDPIFGRHREIRQCVDILCRRRKNNPMIVGEPGVGKSALVEGLALAIVSNEVPESLRDTDIQGLDLGLLQAGASVRGEFENRLKGVIQEVKASDKRTILFIDEAHTLIGAGGSQGGSDAANLLKPALARGELRTIAATTWAEYKKYFEKDAALERRFQPVKVDEPNEDDAIVMMRGLKAIYEEAHQVRILDEAVTACVDLSIRYITGRQLPDKAVDLLDTTAARVRVSREARPEDLVAIEERVAGIDRKLSALQRDHGHGYGGLEDAIASAEDELADARKTRDELASRWEGERQRVRAELDRREDAESASESADGASSPKQAEETEDTLIHVDVTADAVARTVSAWTGIPLGKMKKSALPIVTNLEARLRERVKGQEPALTAVSEAVRASYAGIRDPDGPIGVLLFVGPSGVGKTETALALTDFLYGEDRFLTTINMTEFTEAHSVSRLVGSPPGYVGYGEGGLLTEAVRQRPYSVVLLDECEKADGQVMNLFYQVFDKGSLTDGEGREINFRNTMIIMTSNLATNAIMKVYDQHGDPDPKEVVDLIRPELSAHFKPALLGRMTIVPYRPIATDTMKLIAELKLNKLSKRVFESHGVRPTVAPEVIAEIAARCTAVETGARNVDHIMRGTLMPMMAKELLGAMADSRTISAVDVGFSGGSFHIDVVSE
ncbi:MAG: type VI secretion system ATPase TssH [Myxococcota bacterium]